MNGDANKSFTPLEIDRLGQSGELREALNLALKEIRAGGRDIDLFYIAATIAFELGDIPKAEQLIKLLLALDPEHLNAWILFGKIYYKKGDLARSDYGMKRAEELFPAVAEMDLLAEMKQSGDPKAPGSSGPATVVFETETYADICVTQGYFNKALKIYNDLLERFPENRGLEKKIDDLKKKMARQ